MKKAVEVTIMGQKFLVRSESDEEYVDKIAKYVDGKVNEVLANTKSIASIQVALLAAMNIADEYFKFRQEKEKTLKKVEKKIEDMIELVDLQL